MFCSQCVVKVNINEVMICSYFAIITYFFFFFFLLFIFICSVQDVIQIWHVGTVVGVDTETGAEYILNGPVAQEVVNELHLAEVEGRPKLLC